MAADDEWKDITESQDGGILKKILVEGDGDKPAQGVKVNVHYVGTLTKTGEKFDSSRDRDDKFQFELGAGRVIKGWDVGVATMNEGEKCMLRISSDYGYGDSGSPPKIPGGASLDFEVELFDFDEAWESMYQGEGMEFKKVSEPESKSWITPKEEGHVKFNLEVFSDSKMKKKVYSEDDVQFEVQDFKTYDKYPLFLHNACESVAEGCKIIVKSERINTPPAVWNVAENDKDFFFTLEMKSIKNPKDAWQMNSTEKLEASKAKKGKGNSLFKESHFEQAIKAYEKALDLVKDLKKGDDDMIVEEKDENAENNESQNKSESVSDDEIRTLQISCHSNMAMTNLKLENWEETISCASNCLEIDSKHLKSLARRGQAHMSRGETEKALADFTAAVEIDPKNSYNKILLKKVEKQIKKDKKKQKMIAKKMFSKGGLYDEPKKAAKPSHGEEKKDDMEKLMEAGKSMDMKQVESLLAEKSMDMKQVESLFGEKQDNDSGDEMPDLGVTKGLGENSQPEEKEAEPAVDMEMDENAI